VPDAATTGPHDPDGGVVLAETEASAGTVEPGDATYVVAVPDSPPVAAAGTMRMNRLMWLGLGAAALGWLTHQATWSGILVPACRRLVVRKSSRA
jgi:hypothetical protein